jgi:hypothetical protein
MESTRANLPKVKIGQGEGATEVQWALEWRYLGYRLRYDLSVDDTISSLISTMTKVGTRLFRGERLVSKLSATLQVQLVGTMLQGAATYLLSILPLTHQLCKKMDTQLQTAAREILHVGFYAPNCLIRAETRIPHFVGLRHQHRLRLSLSLHHHPVVVLEPHSPQRHPIAYRIMKALEANVNTERSRPKILQSWVKETHTLQRALQETHGIIAPTIQNQWWWQCAALCATHGVRVSYATWLQEMHSKGGTHAPTLGRPTPKGSAHIRATHAHHTWLEALPTVIRNPKDIALSARGPGCNGSRALQKLTSVQRQSWLLHALS